MGDLTNRVVVITGAFGALGSSVALAFAAQGARVALVDIASSTPGPLIKELGAAHLFLSNVELTDLQRTTVAINSVQQRFERLDVLVSIAGGFRWEKLAEGSVNTWDEMYSVNLKTAVIASKAALPHLLACAPGGRIINIGAGAASRMSGAGMGAYTASKAGVQKLTEALSDEVKDRGITVNAILPGTIDTPRNRKDMPDADVARWVTTAAIAEVILFLASERAAAITGAAIPVFGRG